MHREFVDSETGKPVEAKDQVKGYETGAGDYIAFEPEEIAKAVPEADKTLDVQAFVPCDQLDDVYFDRPYYLAPSSPAAAETFVLIRDGMATANVVAVARTVLFRRVRAVLIRAHGTGLIANTLNFDYEVRSAEKAFSDLPAGKADEEMLDLALHISPLTEPTAASQPWPRERGLMPRRRHSRPSVNGSSTVQKTASLNARDRFRAVPGYQDLTR
jgi:DNA end-binding protein Ku